MGILRLRSIVLIGLVSLALVASLVGLASARDLGSAIAAKERLASWLLGFPNVVGIGVSLTADGQPAFKVFTKEAGVGGIPDRLDGFPVEVEVTGEIFALKDSPAGKGGGGGGLTSLCTTNPPHGLKTTSVWPLPLPIGISTGNAAQCLAGTIGARVTDGTKVYALSNNHIYAEQSTTANTTPPLGVDAVQPGLFDTSCTLSTNNIIGSLKAYVPLTFNCTCGLTSCCSGTPNTVDAAVASTTPSILCTATPSNGYGVPQSTPCPNSTST